jgi:DNA-binding GntR family transcriptional regulator
LPGSRTSPRSTRIQDEAYRAANLSGDSQALGHKIAELVREDILLGRLRPDTPVGQPKLSARYGTSRMPARDALKLLMNEGLVVSAGAGTVVARFTVEELEDAHATMAFAHGRAARRAALNASYDELTALTGLHDQMVTAQKSDEKARDGDLADELMRRHVARSGVSLISYFWERGLLCTHACIRLGSLEVCRTGIEGELALTAVTRSLPTGRRSCRLAALVRALPATPPASPRAERGRANG